MLLSLLPGTAWAEEVPAPNDGAAHDEVIPLADTLTYENLSYTIANGEITITDCDESATSVIIPEQIDGIPVTIIGDQAFWSCVKLTSITIPSSVVSIGDHAFLNCVKLTSIIIPSSVVSIGDKAFENCVGLISINISDGVTTIGDEVFYNCRNLTNISIPNSVTSIGRYAFWNCESLTDITIPDQMTSIESGTFYDCTGLANITIPRSVTHIGNSAFLGCTSLKNITIPDSVSSIGDKAFNRCSGLTDIMLPSSLITIGEAVFSECSSLVEVVVDPQNQNYTTENGVLFDKYKGCLIYCPATKTGQYTIPDGVISIENSAFYECSRLTDITIPVSVVAIGSEAFRGCSGLTNVTIPNGVTSIGYFAFMGCSGLTSITLSDNLTSIENGILEGCSRLKSVIIPEGVTFVGYWAFMSCSELTSVTIPESVTSIWALAFAFCSSLTSITIPASVTDIDGSSFASTPVKDIYFQGTRDEWNRIEEKTSDISWSEATIHCIDGVISKKLAAPEKLTCYSIDEDTNVLPVKWETHGLTRDWYQIDIYDVANPSAPARTLTERITPIDAQVYSYKVSLDELPSGTYYLTLQSVGGPDDVLEDGPLYAPSEIVKSSQWTYMPVDPVEPTPPSDQISDKLDSIIDASTEIIKDTLESIAKGDLKDAIDKIGSAIFDKIEELEKNINGSAEIEVAAGLGFIDTSVKVTGAKLNFDYSKSVRLEIGHPEDDSIQVPEQDNAETFRFSMKLIEGANNNVAELEVPIRVTMPIPAQKLKPHTFKLWHFHAGKLVPVTLSSTPYQDAASGQWYVSFKIDGFSDFIMEYEEETTAPPAVTHTISFDTGGAPLTVPAMTTGADGRLSSLPTPSWNGHRFEGWFLADGSRVTTSTVFSGDTTVRARWARTASAPETNFVSIPPSEHGKIITADRFAAEGDRVNLSAHPDKGYALTSITVTAAGGKELTLREKGDGKFSFTMPDRQVKVIAEFEKTEK